MKRKTNKMYTVAIVGRPNVGKSTLFNRLGKRWNSIVEDRPGITRDRLFTEAEICGHSFQIMDTGGLQEEAPTDVEKKMSEQAWRGIQESDLILFMMDGRTGITGMDREWIRKLRKLGKPTVFVVNKLDDPTLDGNLQEFYAIGAEDLIAFSAEKQRNVSGLHEAILGKLGLEDLSSKVQEVEEEAEAEHDVLSLAIVGRPNVGKSTLLNAMLNEERCIVDNNPGTTRDAIHSYVEFSGKTYRFVDTAGVRKRAKTTERVEKFSVMQSLKAIDEADVVLLVMDGVVGPTEQDAHVAGYAHEKGKVIVILVNKWDEGKDKFSREQFMHQMEYKMNFLTAYPVLFISAKTGKNLDKIFALIENIRTQFDRKISTAELNRAFEHIVEHHPLPIYKGQQLKMYYATQVHHRPPTFVVFCNYPKNVHFSYRRYLANAIREIFKYDDVPVRVIFKARS